MRIHLFQHTSERPYQCEVCGQTFKGPSNLNSHRRQHSETMFYKCQFCSKQFKDTGNFKQHIRRHFGDKRHVCEHCGKSFITTSDLKKHIRIHTGEKPYKCDICGKGFGDGSSVQRHRLQHTNKHRFECSMCKRSYTRRDLCMGHVKRSHPNEVDYVTISQVLKNADVEDNPKVNDETFAMTNTTQPINTTIVPLNNKRGSGNSVDAEVNIASASVNESDVLVQNKVSYNATKLSNEAPTKIKEDVKVERNRETLPNTPVRYVDELTRGASQGLREHSLRLYKATPQSNTGFDGVHEPGHIHLYQHHGNDTGT